MQLSQAKKALELADLKFKSGTLTNLDLLDVEKPGFDQILASIGGGHVAGHQLGGACQLAELTVGANWTGFTAPGPTDTATWSGSSRGAGLTLSSFLNPGTTWSAINVLGAASDIDISGGYGNAVTLTNGNITSDGVNANDSAFPTSFPYLASPH